MKKTMKIGMILLIVIVSVFGIVQLWKYIDPIKDKMGLAEVNKVSKNNIKFNTEKETDTNVSVGISKNTTKKLIVVEVEEKYLMTMDFDESLYVVSVNNEDTRKFKQGQEIKVYYDGVVLTSYPGRMTADKIEILKTKSDVEIPIDVLRRYNYSQNNISTSIEEISNIGIVFKIIDTNKIPLDYGDCFEYYIVKKNIENEEYNQNLGIDYNAITPGVTTDTYTTTSSYNPDPNRLKKVWEEPMLLGNEENKICDWEKVTESGVLIGKCDWTNLYGTLESGEYELKAYRKPEKNDSFFQCVVVKFSVDEEGNTTYKQPELGW